MRAFKIILAVFALSGCKAEVGEKCGKPQDCRFGLTCGPQFVCHDPSLNTDERVVLPVQDTQKKSHTGGQETPASSDSVGAKEPTDTQGTVKVGGRCGKPEDCTVGLQCGEDFKCYDPAVRKCTTSDDCRTNGLCGVQNGVCAALVSAHCTASKNCKIKGLCNPLNGKCAAGSKAQCERSTDCLDAGRCTPRNGVCAVGSTADCRRSKRCSQDGLCTLVSEHCAAATRDDCSVHSKVCETDGRCDAIDQVCVLANPEPGSTP